MTRKNKTEFCPGTSFLESFLSCLILSYYCIWSCFPSEGGALVYIAFLPLFTAGAIFMSEPGIFILSSFMNETLSMSWKSLKYIIKDRIREGVDNIFITYFRHSGIWPGVTCSVIMALSLLPATDLNFGGWSERNLKDGSELRLI